METTIVLVVTVLIGLAAFFGVKSSLSNNKAPRHGGGLSREEIKEKFRQLNSMASQVRI